ncbi:50S ribosomal protein L18 [Alicyclobacillus cellulosilyticus]|uniref:Large ribosomal subunit protein uL18 n=1 Tax=Alicyclobacillus cellulosilyticus TaxID=1003997 RepID=A0A917K5N2_9BACL|nr:50S ribosomal protein L18 [Alicyclobacillus cellulosilyticus]GGJ00955.1 50S ribosomal protein L18 [Alicyclobacillus cellulosilyticus]
MITKPDRNEARQRRHRRVRKRIFGTPERPRLNVFRSNKHIYAQVIDDTKGHTLVSASTLDKELRGQLESGSDIEAARKVGELVAKRALEKGVKAVVFDRGGYLYHGRVRALADAAREAGLEF